MSEPIHGQIGPWRHYTKEECEAMGAIDMRKVANEPFNCPYRDCPYCDRPYQRVGEVTEGEIEAVAKTLFTRCYGYWTDSRVEQERYRDLARAAIGALMRVRGGM